MGTLIDSAKMITLSPWQTCDIKHWVLKIARANLHDSFPQIAQFFQINEIDVPSVYQTGDTVLIKYAYADDSGL